MIRNWINELMNLVAGNSRHVTYVGTWQFLFLFILLFFLSIPALLFYFA
ncbi:hypothetical protein ACFS25_06445 [Spirosoma flavum]|uniref:Uncharacterized protein n=1 Tax=Spirosoma flavum TaxID=2048557 RepID=A0ABW6AI11_9BACT